MAWIDSKEPDFFFQKIRLLSEWWELVVASDRVYFERTHFILFCLVNIK